MPRTLFPSGLFGNDIASLMFCDPRILKCVFPTNKDILPNNRNATIQVRKLTSIYMILLPNPQTSLQLHPSSREHPVSPKRLHLRVILPRETRCTSLWCPLAWKSFQSSILFMTFTRGRLQDTDFAERPSVWLFVWCFLMILSLLRLPGWDVTGVMLFFSWQAITAVGFQCVPSLMRVVVVTSYGGICQPLPYKGHSLFPL